MVVVLDGETSMEIDECGIMEGSDCWSEFGEFRIGRRRIRRVANRFSEWLLLLVWLLLLLLMLMSWE